MDLKTKCRDCQKAGNCQLKNSLNEIVQKVIKRTEESVRRETSSEMEYIIITDVTVIPTVCHSFIPNEKVATQIVKQPLLVRDSLVTA